MMEQDKVTQRSPVLKPLEKSERAMALVKEMLALIGENPRREGLLDTPKRVVKSWAELYGGYGENPRDILSTVFEDQATKDMVILKDIPFCSICEHHLLPFTGIAHLAYIPHGKIVGLSKLARLVDCFAKRLQIQEKMTTDIAQAIQTHLAPLGAATVVEAHHQCMSCRGVKKSGATMVTMSMTGVFQENLETRREFLGMIKK